MPVAWRLVKSVHAATAFSGEGAARTGGRWNSRGQHVVYASETRALALLETLVHLDFPVAFHYVFIRIEFPDALLSRLEAKALPGDWLADPPSGSTRKIGDAWLRENRSAVLAVPSAVVPGETNFLLNPHHPDFAQIRLATPEPFSLDPRLRQR